MSAIPTVDSLPAPPQELSFGEIKLRFIRIVPGDPARDFVPYYYFRVFASDGADAGHINFRVGETEHVRLCAGHIGFEIAPPCRGRAYAQQACQALAPFIRSITREVIITCDPDNLPSCRTIERLGAQFIDEIVVPENDPHYARGSRRKNRYRWIP